MEIALLTIWREKNYGAELQAYATIKVLTNMGHKVKMINIRLSDKNRQSFKHHCVKIIESISPCKRKFDNFWRCNIPTTKRYQSIEELQNDPPKADIYMVGSDQVWNPQITQEFQQLYFLNFGSPSIRRISYASSFGQTEVVYDSDKQIHELLNRFDVVSCRECSGVEILSSKFGIKAHHVLDPCFLVDSYSNFVTDTKSLGTLCYYPLSDDIELKKYSKQLAKILGLKPINMNRTTKVLKKIIWNRPSIEEWLNYLAHSNFVITRSFHGITFSLMFQKQFVVLAGRNNRTTRLKSLLKQVNLENRLFNTIEELERAKPWEQDIDYNIVSLQIDQLRKKSINILNEMIYSTSML